MTTHTTRYFFLAVTVAGLSACGSTTPHPSSLASVKPCGEHSSGAAMECGDRVMKWKWNLSTLSKFSQFNTGSSLDPPALLGNYSHADVRSQGCFVYGPYLTLPKPGHVVVEINKFSAVLDLSPD